MPVAGAIADHGAVGHRLGRARQAVHFAARPWRPGHCAVHAGEYGQVRAPREAGRRARQLLRDQLAAWAAAMMTRVTAAGWEIRDRCPALISVMWAWARWDMNSSSAGGITWSAVPISDQDGIVF
jgi:hypothetical protein